MPDRIALPAKSVHGKLKQGGLVIAGGRRLERLDEAVAVPAASTSRAHCQGKASRGATDE